MPTPRRIVPEQAAAQLLRDHAIDLSRPVDVQALIVTVGATLTLRRMGPDVSGMTYRDGDRVIVGLNSGHSRRRQRFTAAHEIGHIVLHPGRPLTVDSSVRVNFRDKVSSQATNTEEIEANAFAAALLMPRDAVLAAAETQLEANNRRRDRLVAKLASEFDVSPEAMGYRLMNLGIISAT